MKHAALLALLAVSPAWAAPMQNDCRGPGSIGTALMSADGTITLNLRQDPNAPLAGVAAVKRGDPAYARILSHVGGMTPGQKKSVPPWC